jgi:hypothetical protein
VFARFAELGSVRRVWLWFRSERLSFPLQSRDGSTIRWIEPGYITVHRVLENPVYAGVYLSITHNFGSDSGSQRDVGQAR